MLSHDSAVDTLPGVHILDATAADRNNAFDPAEIALSTRLTPLDNI